MLVTTILAARIGWPDEFYNLLGNFIFFGSWMAIIVLVAPLRRSALQALSVAPSRSSLGEAVIVAVAKITNPVAIVGALVAWNLLMVSAGDRPLTVRRFEDLSHVDASASSAFGWTKFAVAITLGPFMEELLYRGFLYRTWERQWGWFRAMLATSCYFAILHPTHMISAGIGSVFYVCLLRRTGSLWVPIAAHSLFNLLVQWPVLGREIYVRSMRPTDDIGAWGLEFACLAFLCIALPIYVWMAHRAGLKTPRASSSS